MSDVTTTCRDINALTEKAQKACNLFMAECKKQGLNVLITETYRSQERQNYLYAQGRTRSGKVVTWTKNSRHTSRRAWDICKNIKGQEYSDSLFFKKCGAIAKQFNITWGGSWETPDIPHFEINENWECPFDKEEIDMEELNRIKDEIAFLTKAINQLGDRITKIEKPMVYNCIDDNMPDWARLTIQKLVDKGYLQGDKNGLNLTDELLRMLVINDRVGLYD